MPTVINNTKTASFFYHVLNSIDRESDVGF